MAAEEWIEERAAILEFEAGYSRADAEKLAMEMHKLAEETRVNPKKDLQNNCANV